MPVISFPVTETIFWFYSVNISSSLCIYRYLLWLLRHDNWYQRCGDKSSGSCWWQRQRPLR